jgi:colanic acid/amylovoran biosynthesis glycosyltransferase
MMRILYVVSRFPKTTETFVVNEFQALSNRFDLRLAALVRTKEPIRHEATRLTLEHTWFVPRFSRSNFNAHASWLRRTPLRYLTTLVGVLRTAVSGGRGTAKNLMAFHQGCAIAIAAIEDGIDHIHAHFANVPATAAWVAHRLTGVPFSITAHANDLYRNSPFTMRKAEDAAFVVAISKYNERLLHERAPRARVTVIHCGVDPAQFARSPRSEDRVLCVAAFEPKKGYDDLVHAFAILRARGRKAELVLVGDGRERPAIERLCGQLGIREDVTFVGAATASEVRVALSTAAVFVLAARRDDTGRMDGIPVALMEAMAAGVPVVSTTVSGIPELLRGEAGILVSPRDRDAFAVAIESLLDDHGLAERVAAKGRARVEHEFSLYDEAARLGDLFAASCSDRHADSRARATRNAPTGPRATR